MTTAADEDTRRDRTWALAGGALSAVVLFVGLAIVGTASSFEARRLLDSVLPTVRFAASAYVAAGATILALMLTLITFSISHELDFRPTHYRRIRDIAAMTTTTIASSVLVLMFLSFPIGEQGSDRTADLWVYYVVLVGGAVVGGIFISTILMLYYAVRELIRVGENPESSSLLAVETDEGS